ncbi:hypothetical protein [Ruminococcus sp.]|uniref:hypothetical protein n=1 Tax=Ruminococcus sp. TaxID=41978 RepID=UPI003521DA6C
MINFSLYIECLLLLLSHLKANAVVFKPPNSKLLAIVRLHKRKVFVGFAHTHDL